MILTSVVVRCDGCGCDRLGQPHWRTARSVAQAQHERDEAAAHGWRFHHGRDYCPECKP